jgi:hypothetical protein
MMAQKATSLKNRFAESEENLKRIEKRIEPFTERRKIAKHESEEKWNVTSNLYF